MTDSILRAKIFTDWQEAQLAADTLSRERGPEFVIVGEVDGWAVKRLGRSCWLAR